MPRPPALLRANAHFRRFWAGQTISMLGDQVSLLAIPLLAVLTLHANAGQMGLLGAAELLPYLLFAIHIGAWASGRRGRSLLIGADLGRAALLLSIPLTAALGDLSVGLLYAVAFGVGTLSVVFDVAYQTVFAELVDPLDYVLANSLMIGSRSTAEVGGKSAGGLLVAALTAPVAIVIDALSYLGSAFFVARTPPVDPVPAAAEPGRLADGFRFIARTRLLRTTLAACATFNVFNAAFWAMVVLFATEELGLGAGALGLALGTGALGSVLGSVVATPLASRFGLGKTVLASFVIAPAPLILVALAPASPAPAMAVIAVAEFVSGIGIMLIDIGLGAVQTAVIPDRLRARVAGAYLFVNWGVRPLGAFGGGLLAGAIGLRPTIWIATVGALAGVLWLLPSGLARVRRVSAHAGLTFSG